MSELIPVSTSQHWYRQNEQGAWEACHDVPKKDGKGTKPFSLREAREVKAVPSVTSILRVLPKPALDAWKVEQAILSAVTLPRLPDEQEDAFCARVVEDMDAQSLKAREFGTRIHDSVESYLLKKHEPFPDDVAPFLAAFVQWADTEVLEVKGTEFCVGSREGGYAGRVDLDAVLMGRGPCLVDFKTQKVKTNKQGIKEPAFYPEWILQLSAYSDAFSERRSAVSVVIDSGEPGPVFVKQWDFAELTKGWRIFKCCYEIWTYLNSYDPRTT